MDNWQPGDLALCKHDKNWNPNGFGERAADQCSPIKSMLFPRVGSEWRVTDVEVHFRTEEDRDLVYLKLSGQPSDIVFDARCFTKIHPLTDAEHEEALRDLKAPVREPAQ